MSLAAELGRTEMSLAAELGRTEMLLYVGDRALYKIRCPTSIEIPQQDSQTEERCYWLASYHSGRTEMQLAGGLADEQNKGLLVDSGAKKRCYWLAS